MTAGHVGQRLKYARVLLRLTQGDVARRMGVSPAIVSHWEAGRRTIRPAQMMELARVCAVSLDWLMNAQQLPHFPICDTKPKRRKFTP